MSNKVQIDKRSEKGNITLRLRWWFDGKREQLALGVRDDKIGRSYAEILQKQIERDLNIGTYTGKDKYETPAKRKRKPQADEPPEEITADRLFENYAAHTAQENRLSPGAIGRNKAIASKLRECLRDKSASEVTESIAKNAVSMMSETLSGQTVKTYICLISACWDWAKDTYPSNPWAGCSDRVKNLQTSETKVKFFTIDELETILGAFKNHPVYSFYFDYLLFLAQTLTVGW